MDEDLFQYHRLNESGVQKATTITNLFTAFLKVLKEQCPEKTREFSLVKTKLEEACFFAKKSVAVQPENRQ